MAVNTRLLEADPDQVWEVLADGWLFPLWVVGASRMRAVDGGWPKVGSKLHHSFGSWPLLVDDETEVLACEPGRLLALRARGWPMGEAQVTLALEEQGGQTHVTLEEDVVAGPGSWTPAPVRTPLLTWRNTESLNRLAYLAERR